MRRFLESLLPYRVVPPTPEIVKPPVGTIEYQPMPSFEVAMAECDDGYNNKAVLSDLKTSWFYQGEPRLTDLPDFFGPFFTAIALAAEWSNRRPIQVLDFGGAIGRYGDYAKAMYPAITMDWHVVETPLYIEYATTHGLSAKFYASLDDIPTPIDLAIFSGVLQYLPNWRAPLAHSLVRNAGGIFITRTPTASEEQPFLQRVQYADGTMQMAARVLPEGQLTGLLSASHHIAASWSLHQHLGPMGVVNAPSTNWRRT